MCRYRDGQFGVASDPQNAELAFWLEAQHAGKVLKLARQCGDITAAAQKLGVKLAAHSDVVQRTEQIVAKLDACGARSVSARLG